MEINKWEYNLQPSHLQWHTVPLLHKNHVEYIFCLTLFIMCGAIGGLPWDGGGSPCPVDVGIANIGIWILPIGIFIGCISLEIIKYNILLSNIFKKLYIFVFIYILSPYNYFTFKISLNLFVLSLYLTRVRNKNN